MMIPKYIFQGSCKFRITTSPVALVCVEGHFGSPSGKKKPSNTDKEELANGYKTH